MYFTQNIYTPAPSNIFFIDPVYLKNATSLNANVDDKLVYEAIQTAQDMYILPILGSTLYKEIQFQISGGTISTSQNINYYYLLTSFLQPTLASATMLHLLPFIGYQFKNKGVVTQHSDYSDTASRADIEWIMEKYREKAAFYAQRTIQYMLDNTTIFPEWLNPQLYNTSSGADLFYPESSSYNCGIFLEGLTSNSPNNEFRGWGLDIQQFNDLRNNQ